jgi:AsmA protein
MIGCAVPGGLQCDRTSDAYHGRGGCAQDASEQPRSRARGGLPVSRILLPTRVPAMKVLKIVAFLLGGIVALMAAVAAFVAATFDANKLKGEVTRIVKEKKQRTLKLEGDVALSFWPSIGIRLGKASLSEFSSEKEFASLDGARVSLAVLPLLKKQFVIDRVELSGMKANVVRARSGEFNFDDLLAKDEKQDKQEKDEKAPVQFAVAGVKLADAQLNYRDEQSGQVLTVSKFNLDTGRLGLLADGALDLSAQLAGEKPALNAQLQLGADYHYDLLQKQFAFDKLRGSAKGDAAGVKGMDVALAAARLALQSASGEIEVDKLEFGAKGRQGEDNFDLRLAAPKLAVSAQKAGGEAFSAAVKLVGAQRNMDAKLTLSGVEGSSEALKIAKLALDVDAKQGEVAMRGALSSPLAASITGQTVELAQLAGELNVAHPAMPMKSVKLPLNGNLRADWGKQSAAGELATRFDESSIRAKWSVPTFSPLALGFDIDIDRINVDRYLPSKAAPVKAAEPGGSGPGGPAAEKPIDLSALKGLNANGTIRIGALQVANVKASNVRLDIRANDGKLDVNPLAANLYQGSLAGALSVNAHTNQFALKQNLTGVAINPLMKDALDKDLVEGRGNVSLDVTTGGTTVTQMKKALAGNGNVSLRDGALKGINLAKSFRELNSLTSTKQDAVQKASQSDKTDFSELTASFRIASGVAHNEDLSAKSPFLRLSGAGDIDIGAGAMNYVAKASVVATSGGQEGKDLASLKGVTVPVRVTGPFDALSYKLEMGGLAEDLAKAKLQEKTQELLQKKLGDKAQEQLLKGLFKK